MNARLTVTAMLMLCGIVGGCDSEAKDTAIATVGGDFDHGKQAMTMYGCTSCHTVPGIHGANALVGPPLTSMGARTYIGGVLPNTPGNMIRWLKNPPAIDDKTAMPNLHVSDDDARDMTTYLYSLQ